MCQGEAGLFKTRNGPERVANSVVNAQCGFRPRRAGNGVYCTLSATELAAARGSCSIRAIISASEEWQR